jgi:hypothetical protein
VATVFLVIAVIAFFVAAVCAIAINFPMKYDEADPADLRKALKERWSDAKDVAEKHVSGTRLKILVSAREKNGCKAWLLFVGVLAEGAGVAALAAAVANIVT